MWEKKPLSKLLGVRYPIIQAPMASSSTPELAITISNAGGLGSLAAAMLSIEELQSQCRLIRTKTNEAFLVNFFAHTPPTRNKKKENDMRELLTPAYKSLGQWKVPEAIDPPPPFGNQHLKIILEERPRIVSFHFGLPKQHFITALKSAGIKILSSATCVDEALDLEDRGVDAVIAQGYDAGGHRGTYKGDYRTGEVGTMSLVPQVVDAIKIPVIAAGGVTDGRGIAASLSLGASGVQMGTAFLRCPECKNHLLYRDVLKNAKDNKTRITKAFSGRPARAIENVFIRDMAESTNNLPDFPIPNTLTGLLRKASVEAGSSEYLSLWAGQAAALSLDLPAHKLIKKLITDAENSIVNLNQVHS